jgi:hypothetical protein
MANLRFTARKERRSFLCLRSTYVDKDGVTKSNVPSLDAEGSIILHAQDYVMFVVSEWGIADVYLRATLTVSSSRSKLPTPISAPVKEQILTTPLIEDWISKASISWI